MILSLVSIAAVWWMVYSVSKAPEVGQSVNVFIVVFLAVGSLVMYGMAVWLLTAIVELLQTAPYLVGMVGQSRWSVLVSSRILRWFLGALLLSSVVTGIFSVNMYIGGTYAEQIGAMSNFSGLYTASVLLNCFIQSTSGEVLKTSTSQEGRAAMHAYLDSKYNL